MSNETSTLLTIVALFITTGATVTYVFQQARLRALMEKDLRFRISPLLKYQQLEVRVMSDWKGRVAGRVQNTGNGYGVDLEVKVFRDGVSNPERLDTVPSILAPHDEVAFFFEVPLKTPNYVVEITCTDSATLNDYRFKWADDGRLTGKTTTARCRTVLRDSVLAARIYAGALHARIVRSTKQRFQRRKRSM